MGNNKWNWEEIHKDFSEKPLFSVGKTNQQYWEEKNLTYQDAQEWISVDFEPWNYDLVKNWVNHNFTSQQAKEWINIGLGKWDTEFATYLIWKDHQPDPNLNLEKLKEKFNAWLKNPPAQEYLDCFYPKEQRNTIKKLNLCKKNLTGSLDLRDFVNLEELDCSNNYFTLLNLNNLLQLKKIECYNNSELTHLSLANCSQLKEIDCSKNKLTSLNLTNCSEIAKLSCNGNNLVSLDFLTDLNGDKLKRLWISNNNFPASNLSFFSKFTNLEELYLGNTYQPKIDQSIYNRFSGSLKLLQNLTKLKGLGISNTDLSDGLEYLPESVENFYCLPNSEVLKALDIFPDERRIVEVNDYGQVVDFSERLKALKQETKKRDARIVLADELAEKDNLISQLQGAQIITYQFPFHLIQKPRELMIQAFLCFSPERELLKKLLETHLELVKFKKQETNSRDYDEKCDDYTKQCLLIREQLRKKLSRETMNEIQLVLNDYCEKLVDWEAGVKNIHSVFENQKKVPQIALNIENSVGLTLDQLESERQKNLWRQNGQIIHSEQGRLAASLAKKNEQLERLFYQPQKNLDRRNVLVDKQESLIRKHHLDLIVPWEKKAFDKLKDNLFKEKEKKHTRINQEEKEQSLQLQIGQLQKELTYHQSWKQKHLNDLKEKNVQITELQEKLASLQQKQGQTAQIQQNYPSKK